MNHAVNEAELKGWSNDVIIDATGATFRFLSIPGLAKEQLTNPFELYQNKDYSGIKVAIIGGGLVGIEAALNVAKQGGKPFVVEKMGGIAQTAYPVNRQHLEVLLNEADIPVYLNSNIEKVDGNIIYFTSENEKREEAFDIISECVGMKSCGLSISNNDNLITVGDAVHPENVLNAVWTAYRQCRLV